MSDSYTLFIIAALLVGIAGIGTTPASRHSEETWPEAAIADNPATWVVDDTLIKIPAGVRAIPDYAFADRRKLRRVECESGSRLESVGDYAFIGCDSLLEVTLPRSVTKLGDGCFRECRSLRSFKVPEGVSALPSQAFYGCTALRSIALPAGLADIKQFSFIYCESLETITLPAALRHIGNNAFSRCLSLKEVHVPDGVTEIESYAFSDCAELRRARLPGNDRLLGELIFNCCPLLELLEEPSPTPPAFDCDSYIFDPTDEEAYRRCRLAVPEGSEDRYRTAPGWQLFWKF